MPEGKAVNQMFAGIAGRYDITNHLLSGGMDFSWRRKLVAAVNAHGPRDVLDLATGSGDVAFCLRRKLGAQVAITGMDFCQPMLDEADRKKADEPLFADIPFLQGDALELPLEDESFDAVTIAFGFRNFEDRDRGLREILRVLRPGGALFVLEFTQTDSWVRPFYYAYLKMVLPLFGAVLTGKKSAYDYLVESIKRFPTKAELTDELRDAGFHDVSARGLTLSTVALHKGVKPAR